MPEAAVPPPAPTPAAPATTTPAAAPPSEFGEAFSAIDALGREHAEPEPTPQPTPGSGRPRNAEGKFVKPEKAPEKPDAEVPEADIVPEKLKTSELAKHYHKLKAKAADLEKKLAEKESSTPKEWPEKKSYEERLAERDKAIEENKKRVADYETELQFTNFTRSQTYKDQYEKPLTQAYKAGQTKAAMLQIVERKDDVENIVQAGRDATAADFDAIMRITDERTAIKQAVQMFGEGASVVLQHRENVFQKNALLEEAVKEYQTKGVEREKTVREQNEKSYKESAAMVDNFRKAQVEKFPQIFKPDDSDPKSKELIDFGNHLLERVLRGGAPIKDGEKQWTNEENANAAAAVRNKAAAFDRVNYLATTRGKRIKELEKELEQFKSSRPGNGDGKGREKPVEDEDPLKKIWALGTER